MGRGPIKAEFDSLRADHICGHGEMVLTHRTFNPASRVQFPLAVPFSPLYISAGYTVNVLSQSVNAVQEKGNTAERSMDLYRHLLGR